MLAALVLLAGIAAGAYGLSWLNSQRFFLIVEATEVRIARGRMLPFGHEPFVPAEGSLMRAYERFPLPGGMKLPRGDTVFSDRVQLDQALYRLLTDAVEFSLATDNQRTVELTSLYLSKMRALPGINVTQQIDLARLERDASYVEARGLLERARALLEQAVVRFRESAKGGGSRHADGEQRALALESLLAALRAPGTAPAGDPAVLARTATTGTSAVGSPHLK